MEEQLQAARRNLSQYDEIYRRTLRVLFTQCPQCPQCKEHLPEYENAGLPGEVRALALSLERVIQHLMSPDEPKAEVALLTEGLLATIENELLNRRDWTFDGQHVKSCWHDKGTLRVVFSGNPTDREQMIIELRVSTPERVEVEAGAK